MKPLIFAHSKVFPDLSQAIAPYLLRNHKQQNSVGILLDSFDSALQRSNKFLFQHKDELLLFDLTQGTLSRQTGELFEKKWPQLEDGAVRRILEEFSPKRIFLSRWQGEIELIEQLMLDDEEKSVARLLQLIFTENGTSLLRLQPLRGYNHAYSILETAVAPLQKQAVEEILKLPAIYKKKPIINICPENSLWQSCNLIAGSYLRVARANEKGIIADYDSEFLHDYRVALRKVRSLLSLCSKSYSSEDSAALKSALVQIMGKTGALRDLDVYLLQQDNYFAMVPEKFHPGLQIMFAHFAQKRLALQQQLAAELSHSSYRKKIKKLENGFNKELWQHGDDGSKNSFKFAQKIINKRYKKICRIAATITATTDDEIVHELRIHCKKLRYMMMFFAPLFTDEKFKTILKSLKKAQASLGRFNDYSVQQENLGMFLAHFNDPKTEKKVAESVGALTALLYQCQQRERQQVMENFTQFESDTIKELVSELFTTPRKKR